MVESIWVFFCLRVISQGPPDDDKGVLQVYPSGEFQLHTRILDELIPQKPIDWVELEIHVV